MEEGPKSPEGPMQVPKSKPLLKFWKGAKLIQLG